MATRSTIALEFADGTIQQIYCHWDGYLDNNGRILQEHYKDPFKVRELIDHGSISSLGNGIGEKHDFNTASSYSDTTFYARDRGEELTINKYKDFAEYVSECQREEYNYILRNINGQATWFVEFYACEGGWVALEDAFEIKAEVDAE